MKIEIEPRNIIETQIPESRPHGGLAPLSGCPVCEALDKTWTKSIGKISKEKSHGKKWTRKRSESCL